MKANILLPLSAIWLLTDPMSQAATLSDPLIHVGIADLNGAFTTESPPGFTLYGWESLSGGEVLVSPELGESVLSVTMRATYSITLAELDSAPYTYSWTLDLVATFPDAGTGPNDQLWSETGDPGSSPWYWGPLGTPDSQPLRYIKVMFETTTTSGTFIEDNGGLGFRGTYGVESIPEPNSILLYLASSTLFLGRRRARRSRQI